MDASALAPFRYFELVLSVLFGFLLFQEIPVWGTALGTAIIIPSTFFVARYELRRSRHHHEQTKQDTSPDPKTKKTA